MELWWKRWVSHKLKLGGVQCDHFDITISCYISSLSFSHLFYLMYPSVPFSLHPVWLNELSDSYLLLPSFSVWNFPGSRMVTCLPGLQQFTRRKRREGRQAHQQVFIEGGGRRAASSFLPSAVNLYDKLGRKMGRRWQRERYQPEENIEEEKIFHSFCVLGCERCNNYPFIFFPLSLSSLRICFRRPRIRNSPLFSCCKRRREGSLPSFCICLLRRRKEEEEVVSNSPSFFLFPNQYPSSLPFFFFFSGE